ncbi:N-acetylmuramyl-L-alanine amidase, negative regulator of AmpC, AmpD [Halovivax asiaticus JCM 14624]|uniref:N-acetylmuramoyl-L-alanine amidase n=1 Tax=Halovivax asiaticus JCM 14624 TaxID=1227490 RepID=M0BGV4_9EURY|nr:N-acetylmuramoyl-L-alanine amidase [Halovivax asiaticus]ELZ08894.1 N-acetylmuramyl-L-alanine amidase, negative regulator of AmpC, AmpD [Halovivax asiaticus JCM 14624]
MNRRTFLKTSGLSAGIGGAFGAGSMTAGASHRQTNAADRFLAADSSNYSAANRGTAEIDWIVVHCTVGSYTSAIDWFRDPSANVSAHYVISNYEHTAYDPGHVTQMVHHEDMAWHASGTNSSSIGIEHEWHSDYGGYFTEECYQASAAVVRELADQYDIPLEYYEHGSARCNQAGGIIGHRHAPQDAYCNDLPSKSCPGPDWDPDTFMDYVRNGDGGGGGGGGDGPFEMEDGAMTTTDLNGRSGPGLDHDVVETLPTGSVGRIMNGPETADGITWWGLHFSKQDAWVWCSENYLAEVAFFMDEAVVTTASSLNARDGPGLGYDVVETLPQGTTATVVNGPTDADGIRWWGLHVPDYGIWAWCSGNYLASNE